MIISYRHQFVFMHVSKTGGESTSQALLPHLGPDDIIVAPPVHTHPPGIHRLAKHSRLDVIRAVLGHELDNFFKFGFVRNPWDRVVSFYHYQARVQGERGSFADFLPSGLPRASCTHATSGLDFVGRFEQLDSDFGAICAKLGLAAILPRLNVSKRGSYRSYYDAASRTLIADRYAEDIEKFEYQF